MVDGALPQTARLAVAVAPLDAYEDTGPATAGLHLGRQDPGGLVRLYGTRPGPVPVLLKGNFAHTQATG
jgi:hypothetical protein